MATNAVYKIYDGSSWIEYHFATNAGQVTTTSGRKFVTSSVTVNGVAFTPGNGDVATVTINASNINWYGGTKPTTNYLSNAANIQAALVALDTAAKNAYDNIPSGILTSSNYAATLDSVYQAIDDDLTAIAGLTGAGLLKRNSSGTTWTLDQTSYVPTSRTINAKALSNNITLYGSDIALSSTNSTKLDTAYTALVNQVNGMSKAIALDNTVTTSGYKNAEFVGTGDTITITGVTTSTAVKDAAGNDVLLTSLHIGDSVFVTQTGVPDRWLSSISGSSGNQTFVFSKLETYNLAWGAISGKPTTISGYGITDCSLNNSTGAITIGSVTKTPLYEHQDISGKANDSDVVHKGTSSSNQAETIYGIKTFKSSPLFHGGLIVGENDTSVTTGRWIRMWAVNAKYAEIKPNAAMTSNIVYVTLPASSGTLALQENHPLVVVGTGSSAPTHPLGGEYKTGDIWINTQA